MAFDCQYCDRTFDSEQALLQHIKDLPAHPHFRCGPCKRNFKSKEALDQNSKFAPAHADSHKCAPCKRSFKSEDALQNHIRDSPAHAPSFNCNTCSQTFGSEEALQQHTRDSHATVRTFGCDSCERKFKSDEALQQHTRDSHPQLPPSFDCDSCERKFKSDEALQQHTQESPAHTAPLFNCATCSRTFGSEEALQQHTRDSHAVAQQQTFDCDFCSRKFKSTAARLQHTQALHVQSGGKEVLQQQQQQQQEQQQQQQEQQQQQQEQQQQQQEQQQQQQEQQQQQQEQLCGCAHCDKTFKTEEALQQHTKDMHGPAPLQQTLTSPEALQEHLETWVVIENLCNCEHCETFKNEEALQQHTLHSHSPARFHQTLTTPEALQGLLKTQVADEELCVCEPCNKTFKTEEALQQHIANSAAHAPSGRGESFERDFVGLDALEEHRSETFFCEAVPRTPLDEFFLSFATFKYNPSQPPATSFRQLRRHKKWEENSRESKEAWNRYQDALESELNLWFGSEESLTAWHTLCRAIGIEPPPDTRAQCKKIVRKQFVNIIDLIEWARARESSEERVQTFKNLQDLKKYSKKNNKIFSRDPEDRKIVLRHLLRRLFR